MKIILIAAEDCGTADLLINEVGAVDVYITAIPKVVVVGEIRTNEQDQRMSLASALYTSCGIRNSFCD
ncbi:MAG: hypothetical protein GY777_30600 [Candidatus Brocadiaceae bacterium]|nr:hypothetical protein [Candidatus Brocadiaceae bacterium]